MSGEHERPVRRIGSRRTPAAPSPVLHLRDFLRAIPAAPIAVPASVDDTTGVTFALDRNDEFGVCGPTGIDNLRRLVTTLLTGTEVDATWTEIVRWYRSQNPGFDENDPGGPGDQGVELQKLLAWLVKQGVILGFAAVDPHDDDELRAALYLFLGLYCGGGLQQAQQEQTDAGTWDYTPGSPDWGGHCFVAVKYRGDLFTVITWDLLVDMTQSWRQHCLDEVYVVLLPEHVQRPDFRAGFDLPKFAAAYTSLTGRPFPVVDTPPEPPTPHLSSLDVAVQALLADPQVARWLRQRHAGVTRRVAHLVEVVVGAAQAKGL